MKLLITVTNCNQGHNLYVEKIKDEDNEEYCDIESCVIDFELPHEYKRLYVVEIFPDQSIIYHKDYDKTVDETNINLKLFSQFNGCFPFNVVTNSYPKITDSIKTMPEIILPKLDEAQGFYVAIWIYSNGEFNNPILLLPCN